MAIVTLMLMLAGCAGDHYLVKMLDDEAANGPYVFSPRSHHFDDDGRFIVAIDDAAGNDAGVGCAQAQGADSTFAVRPRESGSLEFSISQAALTDDYDRLVHRIEAFLAHPEISRCIDPAFAASLAGDILERIPKSYAGLLTRRNGYRPLERRIDVRPGDWLVIEYVGFSNGAVPCYVATERVAYRLGQSENSIGLNTASNRLDVAIRTRAGTDVPVATTFDLANQFEGKKFIRVLYPPLMPPCGDEVEGMHTDSWPLIVASVDPGALDAASKLSRQVAVNGGGSNALDDFCASPPPATVCLVPLARSVEVAAEVSTPVDTRRLVAVGTVLGDVLPVWDHDPGKVRLERFYHGTRVPVKFDKSLHAGDRYSMPLLNGDVVKW